MNSVSRFLDHRHRRDFGFIAIMALVIAVAGWLLAMPIVPAIARQTMNRFHLRGDRFLVWAIQQPIPAMYNFANQYEVYAQPPGAEDWVGFEPLEAGYVNHFPTRMITFADARYRLFFDQKERWYQLHSSYRGRGLTTRIHVGANADGVLQINRVASREDEVDVWGIRP